MAVVGTAGHVDHGKTTLVRALTGVDTDRLPEEKRRGITIELGFAPMVVDIGGEKRSIAIVDVPGHERFVGTMVAGAQGVDVALLVVAADAGVMPQTREHLAILEAIGVRAVLVALTRCDVADAETRALARVDVEEALARTPWSSARIFEVSGKTGEGIDALKAAIVEATSAIDVVARESRPARLPIDRAFAPRGQGVVVTGTLIEGVVNVGDELQLLPRGVAVRVRGLHAHGRAVTMARAGGRLAIALAGVELSELRRGDVLAAPGGLLTMRAFDAIFTRPEGGRAFGRRARVSVHVGTDEVAGRLISLGPLVAKPANEAGPLESTLESTPIDAGTGEIGGGARRFVRVVLARPIALSAGDRLVVRGDAPLATIGTTLGALQVLRVAPGRLLGGRDRYVTALRRLIDEGGSELSPGKREAKPTPLQHELRRATFEIEAAGLSGIAQNELSPRLERRAVSKELARALSPLELRGGASPRWVGEPARAHVRKAILAALGKFHAEHPDEDGAPVATIVSQVPANAAAGLAEMTLERAIAAGEVLRRPGGDAGDRLRTSSFQPRARADDPIAIEIARRLDETGLAPPTLSELAQAARIDAARARALATALAAAGSIVHVQGDLWFSRACLETLRSKLIAQLEAKGQITTGEFKELVGSSRKYVVPLAEWFDTQRVTLRVGDVRKLRRA